MYEFRDLTRITTVATVAVAIYMVADLLTSTTDLAMGPTAYGEFGIIELLALVQVITLFACFFIVGRWIYRAAENAHAMSDALTISPGWAVGWYFVPIANLFKPFQAMKEIWFASVRSAATFEERTPALIGWWWGLWLVNNVIGNISFRMAMNENGDPQTLAAINMLATAINVPLCIVLVMVMREVAGAQKAGVYEEVFA